MITITVDTSNVTSRLSELDERLANVTQEPMLSGFTRAAALYLGFIRRRFVKAARGDGTWQPLAESTKRHRMNKTKAGRKKLSKARSKDKAVDKNVPLQYRGIETREVLAAGNFEILRDTGILFNSLTSGAPGNVLMPDNDGIVVGTAIKYAGYHQEPATPGRPPKREILVPPDEPTTTVMRDQISRAVADVIRQIMGGQ